MLSTCEPFSVVQVDPSCSYNIVSVVGFQPTFRLAGGVNLPKIITCRCSDGVDRRQLVKVGTGIPPVLTSCVGRVVVGGGGGERCREGWCW